MKVSTDDLRHATLTLRDAVCRRESARL